MNPCVTFYASMCIRIYYMYTSDCSNRDGFARNTSSSYHTCKHHQSTLNQMNIYLIYYIKIKSICRHHFRLCLRCLQYHSLLYQACLNALGYYFITLLGVMNVGITMCKIKVHSLFFYLNSRSS